MTELDYLDKLLLRSDDLIEKLDILIEQLKSLESSVSLRLDFILMGVFIALGVYLTYSVMNTIGYRV